MAHDENSHIETPHLRTGNDNLEFQNLSTHLSVRLSVRLPHIHSKGGKMSGKMKAMPGKGKTPHPRMSSSPVLLGNSGPALDEEVLLQVSDTVSLNSPFSSIEGINCCILAPILTPVTNMEEDVAADKATDILHGNKTASKGILTVPTNYTDDNSRDVTETTLSRFLKNLNIEEVTSYNFGIKDILKITKSSLNWEKPGTLKEKILDIISKLIMLNKSPFNMPLIINDNKHIEIDTSVPFSDEKTDIEREFFAMFMGKKEKSQQQQKQNVLHPSDVIVILMNCCDYFVRQVMIQKMTTCQLAVPLIIPDLINDKKMFLLWTMRNIHFKWKIQSMGAEEGKEGNPVTDGIPIISAIRMGTFLNSKSKILNDIICIQSNDIFFHKQCDGGQLSRTFSNGVVELAWYLPGGKDKDSFEDIWTLANLRGDAINHKPQYNVLKEVSSIMLIFLSIECISDSNVNDILKEISNTNQHLIFVFLDPISPVSESDKKLSLSNFFSMFSSHMHNNKCSFIAESAIGKERNAASLKTDIRTKIKESLTSIKKGGNVMHLNLENVSHYAFRYGINIDENNKDLQKGKTLANGIMNKLWDKDPKDRKRDILHLQKKFISWSEYSKQLKRMEDIDFDKIHNRMQECRKEQFDMVQNMTSVMKEFIDISLNSQLSNQTKMYFLQWMKIYLDIESKKHLPDQENKYHKMWNSITCKVGTDVNELRKLESTLDDLSFGLEHILREIGQVYEAIKELKRERKFEVLADNLSIFAADLLLDGYPLEIMDGDASHVPLTWINAVFDKLKERLGDKKIYVISVLGIQSSGKSTLLNTMFGLNFSVSAGRCTKGVFAQLISVEEKIYGEYGYEYILVLDTEGLRAMELANLQYKRDNELASFIIGIGAVTIVNIKGENNSDIGEVLQICVHAFLRMRLANNNIDLQPGCYFVHQNVPDVIAKSKMLYSYKKHKDQLDDIATAVAEHENVRGINHFSDVIEFDVNKQIWYFPNLWIGDPPMAPANPGYSETVLKLKTDILKYPEKYSSLTFTKLQERMTDLWKAILNENFVFSFKNSLEVRSYALLEEKILNVNKNFYHDVKSKTHNYINTINSCEKDFSCLKQNILAEIEEHINECYLRFKSELNDYFSTAENKSTINQWEAFATQKLEEIVSYLRYNESNKISTAVDLREANYKNLKKLEKYK
ncbi:unnamed protein product, partial [Meganyctiphanes norvegica]